MEWLSAEVQKGEALNYKKLEQVQGFLVYFLITYSTMTTYPKDIYLKLDNQRGSRDENGWHLLESELKSKEKNPETR